MAANFQASLPLAVTSLNNLSVRGLSLASGALPILSALDPVPNGSFTANGDGTYSYLWTPTGTVVNNGYSNVYAVEINTATEGATPIASRRRLVDVSAAGGTAGTVWIQAPGTGAGQSGSTTQWKAIIHPSDSLAPGSGTYRYEVVSRDGPAEFPTQTVGDAALSGLELVGSSNGYGSLSGPTGFVGDRLALLHGTTHNAVLGGGSLQRSVFYESGSVTGSSGPAIQLAWYTGTGTGLRWNLSSCLFYANVGDRLANCLIAHTSNASSYDRGDISDTAFIGARWSNGSLQGTAIDYAAVAAGTINRVYVQAIQEIFGFNMPLATEVKNSVFRQVGRARVGGNFHDNIVLAESVSDPASPANAPTALLLQQNGASATNNILWARGVPGSTAGNGEQVKGFSVYPGVTTGTATHNIFALDPATVTTSANYFQGGPPPSGLALDYNLVICTGAFYAAGTQNNFSWVAYQANNPTLDVHSLFVDLSGDPRGLKAVFADPINGDFRWAQTAVAAQCAAYCQANNVGPATVTTHWPVVPTVDAAVAAISLLPPKITSPSAVTFTNGAYGGYQITTNLDGTPSAPTNYSAAGQPAWLSVNASTGVVTGTPPQTGDTSMTVSATNAAGIGSAALEITVQTAFMAWQNTYFTAAELNNPAISGSNAAPAGDGISNLTKYALGLNPKSDGSGGLPTISLTPVGSSKYLTLTYNKSLGASDVTYTVEVSSDLQTWSSGTSYTATISATNNSAGTMQTVVQRDLTPTSGTMQRFIRLKINQP